MQGGRGQGQALFPTAGQRSGQLLLAIGKAQALQRLVHPLAPPVQAVDPGGEQQVFLDRQVLVERELLGHVANLALDLFGLGDDVEA